MNNIQITVPGTDSEKRSIELNERKTLSKTPPPRLSVKERLGGKVEDIRRPREPRVVHSAVNRVKSRSKTPKKEQTYRRVMVDNRDRKPESFSKPESVKLIGVLLLKAERIRVSPGRPQKSFEDSSERSKRQRTEDLRSKDVVELTYATHMKLRHVGKVAASKVVKDLSKSPQRAKKYVKAFKKSTERQDQPCQLSPLQALSMFTEAELTKAQYERVRETNPNFFPCYSVLQKVKKDTYPEIHRVTETCAEVLVQNLMDHTASRLIQHLGEAAEGLNEEEKRSLILISKWGCDGSQQVQYKMKFDCEDDSDANIFQTSVVPLQLIYSSEKKILWQNPTPSSPRYCRPIRIRFVKETTDVTNISTF
ncbi:hypothetical protein ACJJTC_004086 [Scirpophaga incertulas]